MDSLTEFILQSLPKIITQVFDATVVEPICCLLASDAEGSDLEDVFSSRASAAFVPRAVHERG
jgi:hypothetical protein